MFIVLEIQTNDGVTSIIPNTYSDESIAMQKYHEILSFAAVSEIDIHTAVVLNESGMTIRNENYIHNTNTEE